MVGSLPDRQRGRGTTVGIMDKLDRLIDVLINPKGGVPAPDRSYEDERPYASEKTVTIKDGRVSWER